MRITITASTEVERNIAPPMKTAITLPVVINGRDTGLAIYVSASPFAPQEGLAYPSSIMVAKVAGAIEQAFREGREIY